MYSYIMSKRETQCANSNIPRHFVCGGREEICMLHSACLWILLHIHHVPLHISPIGLIAQVSGSCSRCSRQVIGRAIGLLAKHGYSMLPVGA